MKRFIFAIIAAAFALQAAACSSGGGGNEPSKQSEQTAEPEETYESEAGIETIGQNKEGIPMTEAITDAGIWPTTI
ncbi:MAG: hypothetical protein IJL97_04230, partial [Lachnospiraceae bacterium]|nr:hypothetical protein [Lachnospiraceae bacterium]